MPCTFSTTPLGLDLGSILKTCLCGKSTEVRIIIVAALVPGIKAKQALKLPNDTKTRLFVHNLI